MAREHVIHDHVENSQDESDKKNKINVRIARGCTPDLVE